MCVRVENKQEQLKLRLLPTGAAMADVVTGNDGARRTRSKRSWKTGGEERMLTERLLARRPGLGTTTTVSRGRRR